MRFASSTPGSGTTPSWSRLNGCWMYLEQRVLIRGLGLRTYVLGYMNFGFWAQGSGCGVKDSMLKALC